MFKSLSLLADVEPVACCSYEDEREEARLELGDGDNRLDAAAVFSSFAAGCILWR